MNIRVHSWFILIKEVIMKRLILQVLIIFILINSILFAAGTYYWTLDNYQTFNKGKLDNMKLSEEGVLSLSLKIKQLSGIDAMFIWDMKEDSNGNIYIATGNEGIVYKMDKKGKTTKFFETDSLAAFRILIDKNDDIYVATLTKGIIYKVDSKGKGFIVYTFKEESIWDIEFYHNDIIIATGPPGILYQLNVATKKIKEIVKTKEMYIISIAVDKEDIYLGTSEKGAIYKLTKDGHLNVIYQVGETEVHSLIINKGLIYAGTSDKDSKLVKVDEQQLKQDQQQNPQQSQDQSKSLFTQLQDFKKIVPAINTVYEIKENEYINKIIESKDTTFLSLVADHDSIYIGSGDDGIIYRYLNKKIEKIAQLEEQQILCFAQLKNRDIILGTGNIGHMYLLEPSMANQGEYLSQVFDANGWAFWGKLQWDEKVLGSTFVSLQTRTGNVEDIDDTWSDWSVEYNNAQGSKVSSPTARFFQFKINFKTRDENKTPEIYSVSMPYLIKNKRPEIMFFQLSDEGANTKIEESKDKRFQPKLNFYEIMLVWEAKDPDKDDMQYSIYAQQKDLKNWVLIQDKILDKKLKIDTRTIPDGVYYFKLIADDIPSNGIGQNLTNSMISKPYIIDNTPPEITLEYKKRNDNTYLIQGVVKDNLSNISKISYSIDTKDWVNVFPEDLIFDSDKESFNFNYQLDTGIIMISAQDASGNTTTKGIRIK